MELSIVTLIIAVVALLVGIVAGKFIFAKDTKKKIEEAELHAQNLIKEAELRAETVRKEKELAAKEKFVQLKAEHDRDVLERNRKLGESENRLRQKEQSLNQKTEQLERQIKENNAIKENLNRQLDVVGVKQAELEKHQEEHTRRLEKLANLTAEEAKAQLVESLKQEAHSQAIGLQQEIIDEAKQKANKEARKIIIQSIQRTAAEQAIENAI
ncbi:MAG TPA: Rnase Y domain-containing protein, partial [Flavisolibacter sp.]|nr:Rnase Y domain-containing protein [Flavisolibacter sp.]